MKLWIIDWLSAKTEREAAEIWEKQHPHLNRHYYSFCPEIREFWDSPMGRFVEDWAMFWFRVMRWINQFDSRMELIRWRISWRMELDLSRWKRML